MEIFVWIIKYKVNTRIDHCVSLSVYIYIRIVNVFLGWTNTRGPLFHLSIPNERTVVCVPDKHLLIS